MAATDEMDNISPRPKSVASFLSGSIFGSKGRTSVLGSATLEKKPLLDDQSEDEEINILAETFGKRVLKRQTGKTQEGDDVSSLSEFIPEDLKAVNERKEIQYA